MRTKRLAHLLATTIAAAATGCGPKTYQFADAAAAATAGQSLIVGQLAPHCHISHIQIHQAGKHVATIRPADQPGQPRRFAAAVAPGPVVLKAYIDVIKLPGASATARQLPVKAYFVNRLDVPPRSITYIGKLADMHRGLTPATAPSQPDTACRRAFRVWVTAVDDWAGRGGAAAYLQRYHPGWAKLFETIRTVVRPIWLAE